MPLRTKVLLGVPNGGPQGADEVAAGGQSRWVKLVRSTDRGVLTVGVEAHMAYGRSYRT
jgi:hypothetical protein